MMICVGNTLKNVEVEMTPCFEKARFIECAKHLCDYEEDRAKRVLFQIFDELRDGFEYDAKFASSDDLYEIRTYIPQKFLRNDILVDYINACMNNAGLPEKFYLFMIFLKSGFQLDDIVLDMGADEGRSIYNVFMESREWLLLGEYDEAYSDSLQFGYYMMMRGFRVEWPEELCIDSLDKKLSRGEKKILQSCNPHFIEMAFKKGFLIKKAMNKYIEYIMNFGRTDYMTLMPLLIKIEAEV